MTNNKNSTRYYSGRQEKKVTKKLGGKQVANSGAPAFVAGDVITDQWLIECKTSTSQKKSFSIKEDWLIKNQEEAFAMGKNYHALCFDFGPDNNMRYYVITEREFQLLQNYLKEEDNEGK